VLINAQETQATRGKPMARSLTTTIQSIIESLEVGVKPSVSPEELPCFLPEALVGNPDVKPESLDAVLATLNASDIPTFKFALEQIGSGKPAWLGFKIVTDPALAVDSLDTKVVAITGKGEGSADALPGIFVATEDSQIVFSRSYSHRDSLQMLDITRGPHMHSEQYAGVAWLSIPLEQSGRVFIFGAGEIAHWIDKVARDVDFETIVIDDNAEYLNPERLPFSKLIQIESFDAIGDLGITPADYVLVLTRGHMHDPEALIYGIKTGAQYVGMMGCMDKNKRVFDFAEAEGVSREQLEATHTPIGLKFGAKTSSELALCIVAELIQTRYNNRKVN
jgi:xanthine dehydrogenase accessory factor